MFAVSRRESKGKKIAHKPEPEHIVDPKYGGYEFIEDIMTDKQLRLKSREEFFERIGKPYIEDEEFRKKFHGASVIFTKHKLIDVVSNFNLAYEFPCNHCKLIYYIGDDQPCGTMY